MRTLGSRQRRPRYGPVAAVAAVVLFVAGCAGGTGADEGPEEAAAPAAGGKALGQQALEQAIVTQKDLPGRKFDALLGPPRAGSVPVNPAVCEPVDAAVGLDSPLAPQAHTKQVIGAGRGDHGGSMALASYAPDQAAEAVTLVRTALSSCKAFTPAYGFPHEEVTALPDPGLGSESVSFRLIQLVAVGDEEPRKVPVTVTMVRVGATVATFQSTNIERDGHAVVPPDVVSKQLTKLADENR